mgnify:CR=1 FL=1
MFQEQQNLQAELSSGIGIVAKGSRIRGGSCDNKGCQSTEQ